MWLTVGLVVAVVAILFFCANKRPPGFPPGPFAYPVVGNALTVLFLSPKVALRNFVRDYGGILSFKMFGRWIVMVNDPGLMRSSLDDSATAGRTKQLLFEYRDEVIMGRPDEQTPHLGILGTSGDVWKNERRFALRTLKDLGFGRNTLEPIMQQELKELLQLLRRRQGEKIDVGLLFYRSMVNVLWAIIIGKRYSYDDKNLQMLIEKVLGMMESFKPYHPAFRFRWVKKLFPNLSILRSTDGVMGDLLSFIEEAIEANKEGMKGQEDTGSYIGAYLQELERITSQVEDGPQHSISHLKANITDMFLAGSESTSSTTRWAIYYLASNPKVQQAVQDEMDRVVGRDNMPTLAHMEQLPYTLATIYEVQRVGDIVPYAVLHESMNDVTIGNYRIPKGMVLLYNLSHALEDAKYWQSPEKFMPERFLSEDGKLIKPDAFLPFGHGKRLCIGESVARLVLFLFLASLLHSFTWTLSEDPVEFKKVYIFKKPPKFTLYATSRHQQHEQKTKK